MVLTSVLETEFALRLHQRTAQLEDFNFIYHAVSPIRSEDQAIDYKIWVCLPPNYADFKLVTLLGVNSNIRVISLIFELKLQIVAGNHSIGH